MKWTTLKSWAILGTLLATGGIHGEAQTSELDTLKSDMQTMQKNMEAMQKKIDELEKQKAAAPETPAAIEQASPSIQTLEKAAGGGNIGEASPVSPRGAFNDRQDAAPRPGDLTLDPKYRGYIPVPNTPALIKFNAKPRVDFTSDNRNSGDPDRFVTAQIPVQGQPEYGGGEQFNVNSRGSQLKMDVRAPDVEGNFRFCYQNDFFGSGSGMSYRLTQLYGEYYNVTAGYTYSVFEDPDAWPDTVDYEGPNSVIYARRALVRYMLPLNEEWQMNFGIEAPDSETDVNSTTTTNVTQVNSAPDGTMNVRWENARWGHVQCAGVVRDIGSRGPNVGDQSVFGWGLNLATSLNVFEHDTVQGQLTYGEGLFRYFNDNFFNNDAAYNSSGNLVALPVFGVMGAYTHQWCDSFRSTASYGYVNIDNQSTQGADAYHRTDYGSLNVVWQIKKRLSIGLEGLYGRKETQSGATGDVWRVQLGLVFALFD